MPDLGKYAVPILMAYGSTITILFYIFFISLYHSKKAKNDLEKIDKKRIKAVEKNN
jgi:hypothetical protein